MAGCRPGFAHVKEIELVTEATKKIREILAFGLLGVAAVLVVTYFFLLFKTEQGPFGKGTFSTMSALEMSRFVSPVLVGLIVLAVVLVTHLGDVTNSARNITISALVLLGVMMLLGLVTWIAALTADNLDYFIGDGLGQGKVTGSIVQLAYLALAGLAGLFTFTVLSALPAPVRQGAAQAGGWAGYDPSQFGQGQPGQPAGAQQWAGQQPADPSQPWPSPAEQQQWAQPAEQQWGQPSEQSQWGQQPPPPQWEQPSEPSQWGQPSEPGQPAGWNQPPWPPAEQQPTPPAEQQQPSPAEQQQWAAPPEPAREWSEPGQHADLGATQQWSTPTSSTEEPTAASEAEQQFEEQSVADDQPDGQEEGDRKEPESPSWWSQPPP
jgi:hypothetical protein